MSGSTVPRPPARAVAASLALAVCLAGGLALAGPAAAALPPAPTGTTSLVTATDGPVSALIGHADDPVSAAVVDLADTRWAAGDRLLLTLPDGYSFARLPSATVPAIPAAGTTYAPHVALAWADASSRAAVSVTFTDSAPASAATADLDLRLRLDDQDISVPAGASPGVVTETVQGQESTGAGTDASPAVWRSYGSADIATARHYLVFAAGEVTGTVVGAGAQSIDGIGVDEAGTGDLVDGTYTLTLTNAVFADPSGTGSAAQVSADAEDTGSAVSAGAGGVHLVTGDAHSITVSITGTSATLLDGFVVDGLRAVPTSAGPITASLTAVPTGAAGLGASPVPTAAGEYESAYAPLARLGGADRYATAAQVAAQIATPATDTVILTSGGIGSRDGVSIDALAASYLAGAQPHPTPILLTATGFLPATTAAAIRAALPSGGTVLVLGGTSAVSAAVTRAVAGLGSYTVTRLQGSDRYDSAAQAALRGARTGSVGVYSDSAATPAVTTAVLASGVSPVDALSAGQVSAAAGLPLLLTRPGDVPAPTLAAITALGVRQVLLLGGTTAVSAAVETQLRTAGLTVVRFAGVDRYDTAAQFLHRMNGDAAAVSGASAPYGVVAQLDSPDGKVYLTSGTALADASVAGPLAALTGRPLLLAPPGAASGAVAAVDLDHPVRQVIGIGGAAVVPDETLDEANRYATLR